MPSREEIVEWLRDYKILAKEVFKSKSILESALQDIENKAAQVDSMRCVTCQWYGDNQQCNRHNGYLFENDGCFSHEPK